MMSGAEMLVQALIDEGVEYIFGYPGGAVLHIYDALFKQDKIEHILVRHEQAAGHMADAYSHYNRQDGRCFGDFRSRCNQHCNSHCNCLYGFNPNGCVGRSGTI